MLVTLVTTPPGPTPMTVVIDSTVDTRLVDEVYAAPTSPNTPKCRANEYCAPKAPEVVYIHPSDVDDTTLPATEFEAFVFE